MPNLPPFFNGKINGVMTLSVTDILWYKNNFKNSYVQFEWAGSQEKCKLSMSKYSKITYDIRTSYKLFLNYLSTCTLKCSVKSHENKTLAYTSMKNLSMVTANNKLVKTLPLVNSEEIIGTLQLCFNLQMFDDTSFDNDIISFKQFGIQNEVLNSLFNKKLYCSETSKSSNDTRPVSSSSFKTSRSKEELTTDYLMGKYMAPEEEDEALSTLRLMPSAESIVSVAEKIGITSAPLQIQGHSIKPGIQNMKTIQANLKKPCIKLNKKPVPKTDDVYLHLSIHSIIVYRTNKSLQNYMNSTYIVQCFKDQEPCKSLRFMSRHVDDNVVKFKKTTQSSCLEGCTAKGITIKSYARLLSQRNPIVLGETNPMLFWTGFSTNTSILQYIKVPIWNNGRITGHVSLSYAFSGTPVVQKHEDNVAEKQVENKMEMKEPEKQQFQPTKPSKSVATETEKNEEDYENTYPLQMINKLYTKSNNNIARSHNLFDEWPKKESTISTKEKEVQTYFKVHQFNKSAQTQIKTFNVSVQVDSDELEDPFDKTVNLDVQNIFRCTHEFTFNIEKKCNSTFDYITYQFPECVTNNTGKVITCCRLFRSYGNTNILHLITLPSTIPLETYFYHNYKKAAIVLNLHRNINDSPEKVSLLVSHLINMVNEFKTSHITKNCVLNNLSISESSHNNIHIKIHYNRVYHSFPSPEIQNKNQSPPSNEQLKKNSKIIVDLTESDSEENLVNKTYTLFKHNDKFVGVTAENSTQTNVIPAKVSHNRKTQTENYWEQPSNTVNSEIVESRTKVPVQKDSFDSFTIIENQVNQTTTKCRLQNTISNEYNNSDIFKAKITIVGGYNLPMVKLNGDSIPSAPTTYVIMEDQGGISLSTPSVVQQTNPVWGSKWNVVLPKNKLIEGKWLILELWCKKYKNEYAGHDAKRDKRLGFIIINLSTFKYDLDQCGTLYDVISETEKHYGKIKILIDPIDYIESQINGDSVTQPIDEKNIFHTKEVKQKSNDDSLIIDEMFEKIEIDNDHHSESRNLKKVVSVSNEKYYDYVDLTEEKKLNSNDNFINEKLGKVQPGNKNHTETKNLRNTFTVSNKKYFECVDLTEDTSKKCSDIQLRNFTYESDVKDYENDQRTISSVASWTSSSDDILYSNNSRIVNDILTNEKKINRIKQIIQG